MKKMLFVFNPRSGKEQIKGQLMEILDIFTRAGYELRVHVTQKQKDAMDVVARLGKKVDVVVCSGGDGTLNETISGMMKLKKMPLLGYIPAGSTNDFATSLGIPKRMPLAAWDIVEGTPFAIDTGTFCEDRNFMYSGLWGFYGGVLSDIPGQEEPSGTPGVHAGRCKESGRTEALSYEGGVGRAGAGGGFCLWHGDQYHQCGRV